jgi:hypothetical protein
MPTRLVVTITAENGATKVYTITVVDTRSTTKATVKNLVELKAAIADPKITTIDFANNITTDEQVLIQRSVEIDGKNFSLTKDMTADLAVDGLKHTIFVSPTIDVSGLHVEGMVVSISNLIVDASRKSYGIQAYDGSTLILNTVTIQNSKGAGLTVNAARVTATALTTINSQWGSVNVDYGTQPYAQHDSTFTLFSGLLNEQIQIWSNKALAGGIPSITVNATGYTVVDNQGNRFWTTQN